jgi:SAM-dependent methyltransferase
MRVPDNCVRGRIRRFIEKQAHLLGNDVLEIGSRMTNANAWWIVNRDLAQGNWIGCDMQPGHGVDVVADIHNPPAEWQGKFSGILCSEVLEHVARPWVALPKIKEMMQPGGWLVVTTLTSFPIHGFPDDYYRYTTSGLRLLLEDAGFRNVHTENAGEIEIKLNDHGEQGFCTRQLPMHVFGVAQC